VGRVPEGRAAAVGQCARAARHRDRALAARMVLLRMVCPLMVFLVCRRSVLPAALGLRAGGKALPPGAQNWEWRAVLSPRAVTQPVPQTCETRLRHHWWCQDRSAPTKRAGKSGLPHACGARADGCDASEIVVAWSPNPPCPRPRPGLRRLCVAHACKLRRCYFSSGLSLTGSRCWAAQRGSVEACRISPHWNEASHWRVWWLRGAIGALDACGSMLAGSRSADPSCLVMRTM
jgi:hypothetical protein